MSPSCLIQKVQITTLLRQSLIEDGLDPDGLVKLFAEWKAEGEAGENLYYYFGKDGFYKEPKRSGRMVLRHVHITPDSQWSLAKWNTAWKHRRRKTSDTALIYAHDPAYGFLLIYFAREPEGHSIARMATPETKKFMNNLANVAEAFIFNGEIII